MNAEKTPSDKKSPIISKGPDFSPFMYLADEELRLPELKMTITAREETRDARYKDVGPRLDRRKIYIWEIRYLSPFP